MSSIIPASNSQLDFSAPCTSEKRKKLKRILTSKEQSRSTTTKKVKKISNDKFFNIGAWSKEEVTLLDKLVTQWTSTEIEWGTVSDLMVTRSKKQCMDKWCLSINPDIRKGPATKEEIKFIFERQAIYGNRWALIAEELNASEISKNLLGRRTDMFCKNTFNSPLRATRKARELSWSPEEEDIVRQAVLLALETLPNQDKDPISPPSPLEDVDDNPLSPPSPLEDVDDNPLSPPLPLEDVDDNPLAPPSPLEDVDDTPLSPPLPLEDVDDIGVSFE